jgi:hypothetical protein
MNKTGGGLAGSAKYLLLRCADLMGIGQLAAATLAGEADHVESVALPAPGRSLLTQMRIVLSA